MKRFALTVASASLLFGSVVFAGVAASTSRALAHFQQAQDEQKQAPQAKTFTGTISKDGDSFMLKDDAGKTSYQLDDQQTASKYGGKKVKVTGMLDVANNLIRVQSIEEASA